MDPASTRADERTGKFYCKLGPVSASPTSLKSTCPKPPTSIPREPLS